MQATTVGAGDAGSGPRNWCGALHTAGGSGDGGVLHALDGPETGRAPNTLGTSRPLPTAASPSPRASSPPPGVLLPTEDDTLCYGAAGPPHLVAFAAAGAAPGEQEMVVGAAPPTTGTSSSVVVEAATAGAPEAVCQVLRVVQGVPTRVVGSRILTRVLLGDRAGAIHDFLNATTWFRLTLQVRGRAWLVA